MSVKPADTATPGSPESPKAVAQQPETGSPELDKFVSPRQVRSSACSSFMLLLLLMMMMLLLLPLFLQIAGP